MRQRERVTVSARPGLQTLAATLALAASLPMAGCTEPADCAREPTRCLPPAYATNSAGPVAIAAPQPAVRKARPVAAAAPAVARPSGPLPPAADNAADMAKHRMRALAPTDAMAARTRDGALAQVQDDKAGAALAPEIKLRAIRRALALAAPALKKHDFVALKAVASQRFAGNIAEIETKYAERFWRHADKYVPVLSGPPPAIALQDQEGGKVQATLTSADGSELRCILVEEGGTWKIDRF